VEVNDGGGDLRFRINEDGFTDPWLAIPWSAIGSFKSICVGTFSPLFEGWTGKISHLGVDAIIHWFTDVGTTGELRLTNGSGGATAVVALPANTGSFTHYKWLHGLALGSTEDTFRIEARVTGGPGCVNIYNPFSPLYFVDPATCTATGL
jgi:hypothetical protein